MGLRWLWGIPLVAALLMGFPGTSRAGDEIVIVVGKQQMVTVPFPIGQGLISNASVVKTFVDTDARRITFFGIRPGGSTYTVFDARSRNHRIEYDIRVVSEDLNRVRDDLQRQIGDIEGVEINIRGDQVIVEGDVALEGEMQRIAKLCGGHTNVQNLVHLSPLAVKALARTIEQNIGRPDVTARPLKDKILLEGVVYSDEQKERAEAIATTLYSNIVNVIEVQELQRPPSRAKTIVLNTHFLSLSKELLDIWSVDWSTVAISPGGISGFFQQDLVNGQLVGDLDTTISGTITAFLPKLTRAKPEGIVRTLANPIVSTKDGSEVSIFTGAEVPFVIGQTATGIPITTFKNVGIGIKSTPYAQGDSIDLKLNINVSDVGDVSLAADSGTGILTTTFETEQFTRAGESVAIGGLFRVDDNVIYNHRTDDLNPQATDSIFQLFLGRQYNKRKGQFIVFITPSVFDDTVSANREMKDLFNLQEVGQ